MGNKKVSFFTEGYKLQSSIKDVIHNPTIRSAYKSLEAYIHSESFEYDPQDLKRLQQMAEVSIQREFSYYCYLLYFFQKQFSEWGQFGESTLSHGFLRCVLQVPVNTEVTYEHHLNFEQQCDQLFKKHQWFSKTKEELLNELKSFELTVLGQKIPIIQKDVVQSILSFLQSDVSFWGVIHGEYLMFFLATQTPSNHYKMTVNNVKQEVMHTPNVPLALAALSDTENNTIYIRDQAIESVFYQKWSDFIKSPETQFAMGPEMVFSNAIRRHLITLIDPNQQQTVDQIKPSILGAMIDNIRAHELGHIINQGYHMPLDVGACIETIMGFNYSSVMMALMEVLADSAPEFNSIAGTFANIVKISKTDSEKATQYFYSYLSDVWFYDTDDEFMYLYSDILMLILIRYINHDKSIDFAKCERDFSQESKNGKKTLTGLLQTFCQKMIQEVQHLFETAIFQLPSETLDYASMKKYMGQVLEAKNIVIDPQSYHFHCKQWSIWFSFLKSFSPKYSELEPLILRLEKDLIRQLIVLNEGASNTAVTVDNYRQYIFDQLASKGFDSPSDQ